LSLGSRKIGLMGGGGVKTECACRGGTTSREAPDEESFEGGALTRCKMGMGRGMGVTKGKRMPQEGGGGGGGGGAGEKRWMGGGKGGGEEGGG